tara:strand:- start:7854 stop:8285 length:432 start_codon:yes stop_codon:yes gene_type:complete
MMEDKLFDYAIQYIRTQKVFRKDAYFEEWNETLRVNNIILLDKATVVDMAMCHIESEMYRIIKEYFYDEEEEKVVNSRKGVVNHETKQIDSYQFPFEIYDYDFYNIKSASMNEYVNSTVSELSEMVDYIGIKYSSLLGSYYFS